MTLDNKSLGLVVILALLSISGGAWADAKKAKAHAEKGQALFDVGRFADALKEYEDAYVEKRDPGYLLHVAQCQKQLDKREDAVRSFKNYLKSSPKAKNRTEVEKDIEALEAKAPASTPPAGTPASAPAPAGVVSPAPAVGSAAPPPSPAPSPPSPATPAGAPGAATSQDPELEAAKSEFEAGVALYLRGQYDGAAERYLAAFNHRPFPAFLFNAAVAYEKGKRFREARPLFEQYLEKDPKAPDAADVRARIATLAEVLNPGSGEASQAKLGAIETKGIVLIESVPPGATVYFNSKTDGPVGKTPWEGSLPSKPLKVIIEARGFKPVTYEAHPGSDRMLVGHFELSQEHFLGWIEITSNAVGASVFIDSKEIGAMGRTPFSGHFKPGKHTIFLEREGYLPAQRTFDVLPGTTNQMSLPMEKVANGWINVVGRQTKGGKLLVNGKPACDTPCRLDVAPGKYQVKVVHPDMEPYETEVVVARAASADVSITRWSHKPPRKNAWTSAVFSGLFLGGGLLVGNLGNKDRDGLKKDIAGGVLVDTNDPRVESGKIKYYVADGLYGLAGLTALFALVGFLSSGDPSVGDVEQKQVGVAPFGGSQTVGLGGWWRF